jgi:hypothetical protein
MSHRRQAAGTLNGTPKTARRKKTNLGSFSRQSEAFNVCGPDFTIPNEMLEALLAAPFRRKNLPVATVCTRLAHEQNPITLRGLLYRVVSAGWLPSTDKEHYTRIGRIMTTLREHGAVPFDYIVDNVRSTDKPSSWSGLEDFAETVKNAYRKNFWASMPEYVHVICEKDAIAGVLAPVTREYDVALSPIRGYVSLSFAHEIASTWNRIDKPIHCYYLGDFDPSGFDLERDVREKLARYCRRRFYWHRLGVNAEDFAEFDLIPLQPKTGDKRYRRFVEEHGHECAELDALPAVELRRRVEDAIKDHIDPDKWEKLLRVEELEKATIGRLASGWKSK